MKKSKLFKPQRILFSTDFSPLANEALELAAVFSGPGVKARLVHVMLPVMTYLMGGSVTGGGGIPVYEEEATQRALDASLKKLKVLAKGMKGLTVEPIVRVDDHFAEGLVREAIHFKADLVCIATHGRSGISKLFSGSVAQSFQAQYDGAVLLYRHKR